MTIQVTSTTESPKTETAKAELSKAEGKKEEAKSSAPEAKASEQKESTDSDTEETEVNEGEAEVEASDEDDKSTDSENDKPKKKGGFQRRIDKLNTRVTAAQQEAEYWKQQALKGAGESKNETKVEPQKHAAAEGEPDPDNFETHREFVKALTRWEAKQLREEDRQKSQKQTLEAEYAKALEAHQNRVQSFQSEVKDYDETLSEIDDIIFSPAVIDAITSSELGPQISYELAKNREEAERIAKLPPVAAYKAIGKLEAKIESKTSETKPEPKKLTKAPQPIAPVGSKGGHREKTIFDPNLSQQEYERLRAKQRTG